MDGSQRPGTLLQEVIRDARLANSLAAINLLPPEILGYMFFLVEEHPVDKSKQTHQICNIVLVCTFWHQVAYATPNLWTIVSVSMPIPQYTRYLRLSGKCPLVVKCEMPEPSDYFGHPPRDHIKTFIEELGQHNARWKEAQLENVGSAAGSLRNKTFLALERLSLTPTSSDMRGDAAVFASFVAPRLKELTIQDNPIPWDCSLFMGLTRLSIARVPLPPSITELATMLGHSPGLRELELSAAYSANVGGTNSNTPVVPIHMKNLLNMSLDTGSTYASALLALINAPNLRRLQIDYFPRPGLMVSEEQLVTAVSPLLYGLVSLRFITQSSFGQADIYSTQPSKTLTVRLRGLNPETWFPFLINRLKRAGLVCPGSEVTAVVPSYSESTSEIYDGYSSLPLVRRIQLPDISKLSTLLQYLEGVSDLDNRFCDLKDILVMNGQTISPASQILQDIRTCCGAIGGWAQRLLQKRGIVVELRGFQQPDGNLVQSLGRILGIGAVRSSG